MKDLGKLLSAYRRKAGLTQRELADELHALGVDVGYRSISTWEKNVCEPSVTAFLHICKILGIHDVMEAYFGENPSNPLRGLNEEGIRRATEYAAFLEGWNHGEYKKISSGAIEKEEKTAATIVDIATSSKIIRIYSTPVSAGNGNFLDGDGYDVVNRISYNVPADADFGVRISGDSMEPRYMNGQIVWVHSQDTLEAGQIGIFLLNDECFCKQLSYEDQAAQLLSLNTKYAPRIVREGDTFRTFGRVIN